MPLILIVVAAVLLERADPLAPGIWLIAGVIVFGVLAVLIDLWRLGNDHFPQWRDDRPNLDIEVADSDRFTEPWTQMVALTVKNRTRRGRRTRTARDAWLHAIVNEQMNTFHPQLLWNYGAVQPEIVVDLVRDIRIEIPVACKAFSKPTGTGSQSWYQVGSIPRMELDFFRTYLMDFAFHNPARVKFTDLHPRT